MYALMVERTTAEETLTREEVATYLERLAAEFSAAADLSHDVEERSGDAEEAGEDATETGDDAVEISVEVGNKSVTLHPPEAVTVSVDVVERSSMLRGERETIDLEFSWKR